LPILTSEAQAQTSTTADLIIPIPLFSSAAEGIIGLPHAWLAAVAGPVQTFWSAGSVMINEEG